MQNKRRERILRMGKLTCILLAVSTVLLLLVSCGGATSAVTLKDVTEETKIDSLSYNVSTNATAKAYYFAALNGYDMTVAGFDDTKLDEMRTATDENGALKYYTEGVNLKAIRAILGEKEAAWSIRPADTGESYLGIVNALTEENATAIATAIKTEVNMENSEGLDTVMRWVGTALRWTSDTLAFGNYLLALFLFALIVEVLLVPLGIKQQKNSIKQAQLRPKEMAIRNKYKGRNDQQTMQKMQQEVQELYQRENFSQFGGCLPLLISLPILMALYYVVIDPLHYMLWFSNDVSTALTTFASTPVAAGGMGLSISSTRGTIEVLSAIREHGTEFMTKLGDFGYFTNGGAIADALKSVESSLPNFSIGSVNFGLVPTFSLDNWPLLFIPVLTFLAYFFSMKLTKKFTYQAPQMQDQATGCSNKTMDFVMPLFSVYITFLVPAVVGCYWIFKSIFTTLKQFILSRVMPYPQFTEDDYRAAEKEYGGKPAAPERRYNRETGNPRVRSLHHIDDEDFEDTRDKAEKRKAAEEELDESERPKAPVAPASTKEDIEKARLKLGRNEEEKKRHEEDDSSSDDETEN